MRSARLALILLALSLVAPWQSARAAICYSCPPEWADWASMLKAIKADRVGLSIAPEAVRLLPLED